MSKIWRRLRVLLRRDRFDSDLEEEMRMHVEMQAEENVESGMSPEEAGYAAKRQFGNPTLFKESSRELWGWIAVEAFARDLRQAWRALRRTPAFTVMAILTLAVGVGANTAMFSVLQAVLLRPLPYKDPGQLVMVWQVMESPPDESGLWRGEGRRTPQTELLARWRESNRSWEQLVGYCGQAVTLTGSGDAERVPSLLVTVDFFETLGIKAAFGRTFLPEDGQAGNGQSAILSDGFWRSRFGADEGILGKTVTLDGKPYTVVGVLPGGFQPVLPTVARRIDVYLPFAFNAKRQWGGLPMWAIGRLKKGTGIEAAQAEMQVIADGFQEEAPERSPYTGVRLNPLMGEVTRAVRPSLVVLAGAVGCVLLIVCVNLAGLMLARSKAREREIGIRAALGAGRWRLARQTLAESVLLGVVGGAVGTALARWLVDLIQALNPGDVPRIEQAAPDTVVFAFGLALSLVAGLAFGALPAFIASRMRLDGVLRVSGGIGAVGCGRLRGAMMAAEVALALMLAVCAGLLLRSYVWLRAIEPGFTTESVLTMQLSFPEQGYDAARRGRFLEEVLKRVRLLPAVESAGAASSLPLAYSVLLSTDIEVKGHAWEKVNSFGVTGGYFEATGIPLVAGRFLREGDDDSVVVNQAFCKRYGFEVNQIVGERIVVYGKERTVVGVAGDLRDLQLHREAEAETFLPYSILATPWAGLAVRTLSNPMALVPAIRSEIRSIDPNQPVERVSTMEEILSGSVAKPRFHLVLLGSFAVIAMGLAALGVYGVIAYLVSQRRNEIGVRMALGAQRGAVMRYVLARGMTPVMIGALVGILGALAATRLLRTLLYGIGPADPITFVFAILLLIVVALAACCIPARRATRIDPMEALRYE